MKTNVMTAIEMTSAASASSFGDVAPADLTETLVEYSFNAQDGSPEGSIFAESIDEACTLWALESLSEYGGGIYTVWGPDSNGDSYSIERSGAEVVAKPFEAEIQ